MKKNIKIGSTISFLDSVDSTNNYTANLIEEKKMVGGQVIMADYQGEGKGQRGSKWQSEKGKNLLVSIYLELDNLSVKSQSLLAKYAAVSLYESLLTIGIPSKIKWPNDIIVDDKKICGILIENQLSGQYIKSCILGFGLNVNQEIFDLDNVTSLKLELKEEYDRMTILEVIINCFNQNFDFLYNNTKMIEDIYLQNLYRINEQSNFYSNKIGDFKGEIIGVNPDGMLEILTDHGKFSFNNKEIKFC